MKLEYQVVSLELAKRLKELGVKQESFFVWTDRTIPGTLWRRDAWEEKFQPFYEGELDYSAFTVAELGEILPSYLYDDSGSVKYTLTCSKFGPAHNVTWYVAYGWDGKSQDDLTKFADTEADARAKMLIYLLENNLITP